MQNNIPPELKEAFERIAKKNITYRTFDSKQQEAAFIQSLFAAYTLGQQGREEGWISASNGWPKVSGWYLTKRGERYDAGIFYTTHPDGAEMSETGWHNVTEYKLIEALPTPPKI